jgi:tRNA-2-methylthio-N6-dimethylallyladenosine synthase
MRRDDGSRPMIAVAGCVAQAESAEIPRRAPSVDIVVGPQAYHRLPEMIAAATRGGRALDTDMPTISKFGALPSRRRQGPSAFLTVQEGCDKFCTYCVVPYTRGAEISRPWDAIADEAEALVDMGAREITLLGQNVNAWTDGHGRGLHHLITRLDRIPVCAVSATRRATQRHDGRADPRPCGGREADALPPSAVQSGQRPGAAGDEPKPQHA